MKGNFYKRRLVGWLGLILAIALVGFIPLRIAIAFQQAPTPQAIFVLGGDYKRTKFAGEFWQSRSNLDIWVSDFPQYLDKHSQILQQFGVPYQNLHLDGQATDTVTNFTTLVEDFVSHKLQHIYLITSDYHMRRSRAIATIVLGSHGIVVTPVKVLTIGNRSESVLRVLRDCGRSVIWIFTDRTGASYNPRLR